MAPSHPVHGSPGMKTPCKNPHASRSQTSENFRFSENSDPNLLGQSHSQKSLASPAPKSAKKNENSDPNLPGYSPSQKSILGSPATKSAKAKKSAPKISCLVVSPPPAVPERKFIVAKKKTKRAAKDRDLKQYRQAAYKALRASQESFFLKDQAAAADGSPENLACEEGKGEEEGQKDGVVENEGEEKEQKDRFIEDKGNPHPDRILPADDSGLPDPKGTSRVRKMRSLVMEEEASSIPEPGSGRVLHLVKAFESLLSIPKDGEADRVEESKKKVTNWELLGLRPPPKSGAAEAGPSSSVFSSTEFFFPPRDLERDSRVCSSFDSNDERLSFGSDTSGLGRRSRRNSSESLRSSWNKKLKVTRQHPFKLRTEQRGRLKEEYFLNKVREMLIEEEKKRIPIAQGLPWTTDEPECLVKPPIKEITEPVDQVLHSDVRALERAAFDHYVAERMTLAEQIKFERERQQKLEEEEEIKKLRKELVPKAQPMPYFDRPFIPKKSTKPQTVPKEPRFLVRPHKACDTTSLC